MHYAAKEIFKSVILIGMNARRVWLLVSLVLLVVAVAAAGTEYRAQVDQACGAPSVTEKRVVWLWQWQNLQSRDRAFTTCVGPSQYAVYRPLDVAAISLLAAGASAVAAVATRRFKRDSKL